MRQHVKRRRDLPVNAVPHYNALGARLRVDWLMDVIGLSNQRRLNQI
ncbi:hypothetical protein BN2364_0545 [Alloalcanivorax xenomutans]|nr:hypothetical protein BN2364_0545 [Alloalcanivorax xenomutans]